LRKRTCKKHKHNAHAHRFVQKHKKPFKNQLNNFQTIKIGLNTQKNATCLLPASFLESLKLYNFGRSSDLLSFSERLPDYSVAVCSNYQLSIKESLQQRVCSGFAPDSLFSAFPERKRTPPKSVAKVRKNFKLMANL
jgi:hypothetical protein